MRRNHHYSCDCGHTELMYCDEKDVPSCPECEKPMWVNFSLTNIGIDKTIHVYDARLGYCNSTGEYRKKMKERGYEYADYDEIHRYNSKIKQEKYASSTKALADDTAKKLTFLRNNKSVSGQISAEIKNTGTSATAKKISEAIK